MKNHFPIAYFGNKRRECEHIFNNLDLADIDTIIEPFCGSGAFSFYCYHYKGLKNVKYILNDTDKNLINLYNLCKDFDYYEYKNKLDKELFNDEGEFITKEEYVKLVKKKDFKAYMIRNLYYRLRPGMYNTGSKPKKITCGDFIAFLKTADIEILNQDGVNIVKKHQDNKNTLIFLDPPYIDLCNDFYDINQGDKNIYEYASGDNFYTKDAYIVFVLNENWLTKLIFKNWHLKSYDKKYEVSRKKVIHMLITNRQ